MGFRIVAGFCAARMTLFRHRELQSTCCWIGCYLLTVYASSQSRTGLRRSTLPGCATRGCTRDRRWKGVLSSRNVWFAGRAFDTDKARSRLTKRDLPQRGTYQNWLSQGESLKSLFRTECWNWVVVCQLSRHLWAFCGRAGTWFCCYEGSSWDMRYRMYDHSRRWFVEF